MNFFVATFLTIFTLILKLVKPGGAKAVIAENLMLRQQLLVVARSKKKSPKLSSVQRIFFGILYFFVNPSRLSSLANVVKPSTILRFHRALVTRKYKKLFTAKNLRKPGPKGPSEEVTNAVIDLKLKNPSYGYQKIADVITTTFGIEIDKDVVRRILKKQPKPLPSPGDGPSWLSFIGLTKDSLYSIDLFRCESIFLKSHWVLVVMDQYSRRIVGFSCNHGSVNAIRLREMFVKIMIAAGRWPRYLSHDNDPLFKSFEWKSLIDIEKSLGTLEDELFSVPYCPTSHPYVERLIGSVRRECLDQVLFFNILDLERKLSDYQNYFNEARVHSSLCGQTPSEWKGKQPEIKADIKKYKYKSYCRGIYKVPIAA